MELNRKDLGKLRIGFPFGSDDISVDDDFVSHPDGRLVLLKKPGRGSWVLIAPDTTFPRQKPHRYQDVDSTADSRYRRFGRNGARNETAQFRML